ncbi:MAG: hypothetical protein ACMG6H_17035 [Acidobacteriota bacterium]
MGIVTYGRPLSEYLLKLTLLETMGIIVNETLQMEYPKTAMPRYDRMRPAEFHVELSMNEARSKVLPRGRQPNQKIFLPVLHLEFLDSADSLSY